MNKNIVINNRYRTLSLLGSGTYSECWKVHDDITNMDFAMKVYSTVDSHGVEQLKKEYVNTSRLTHENVLVPNLFDVYDHHPLLFTPYYPLGSIQKLIGNSVEEKVIWRFIRDVACGLSKIHRSNLCHRNLKPSNVLVNEDNSFVLCDVGLSKNARATVSKNDTKNEQKNLIPFTAPEVFRGGAYEDHSDIWALGALSYYLFEGSLPFEGQGGVVQNRDKSVEIKFFKACSAELSACIKICLDYNPKQRPSSRELYDFAAKMCINPFSTEPPLWLPLSTNSEEEKAEEELGKDTLKDSKREYVQFSNTLHVEKRNWFVTFYECCILIVSLASVVFSYIAAWEDNGLYKHECLLMGLMYSFAFIGAILLLKKFRPGFWIFSAGNFNANYIFLSLAFENQPERYVSLSLGITAISMLLLWGVLLIKREKKSQWKIMSRNLNLTINKWIVYLFCVAILLYLINEIIIPNIK